MSFLIKLTDILYVDLNRIKKVEIKPFLSGYEVVISLDRDDDRHGTTVSFETKEKAQEFVSNLARVSRDHSLLDSKSR